MKHKTIDFFKLKKIKHPHFGYGYNYIYTNSNFVKDATALLYTFVAIELWAKNMQEILKKEEKL